MVTALRSRVLAIAWSRGIITIEHIADFVGIDTTPLIGDLEIEFYDQNELSHGYAPVPCTAGLYTIDKLPTRFYRVRLALVDRACPAVGVAAGASIPTVVIERTSFGASFDRTAYTERVVEALRASLER